MKVNVLFPLGLALALLGPLLLLPAAAHTCSSTFISLGCNPFDCSGGEHSHTVHTPFARCESGPGSDDCASQPTHTYHGGFYLETGTREVEADSTRVVVHDTNLQDCDGDGVPRDFDGDYDDGVGGAFFGYGHWGYDPVCNYGLNLHAGRVSVDDVVWGSDIWFRIGADDTSGPVLSVDPLTGATTCSTDGSITPGDPATDPIADADDCLTDPVHGTGTTCGAGGDGGYWVILPTGGLAGSGHPATEGTVTAA